MDTNLSKLQEIMKDRQGWRAAVMVLWRVWQDLVTEKQQQKITNMAELLALSGLGW